MKNLDLKSPEFAEFLGVLIGDGFIGAYGRTTKVVQITGHKINDKDYYKEYLIPLIKSIFNINIHLYEKENCLRLTIYSKPLFDILKDSINFPIDKKGDIEIPKKVIDNRECKISLLRGFFDTDGTIHLQRKKYPIIALTTTSHKLANQLKEILDEFGFNPYICKSKGNVRDAYRVTIFGKQKVLKWKALIGSSNPYHTKRIDASVA